MDKEWQFHVKADARWDDIIGRVYTRLSREAVHVQEIYLCIYNMRLSSSFSAAIWTLLERNINSPTFRTFNLHEDIRLVAARRIYDGTYDREVYLSSSEFHSDRRHVRPLRTFGVSVHQDTSWTHSNCNLSLINWTHLLNVPSTHLRFSGLHATPISPCRLISGMQAIWKTSTESCRRDRGNRRIRRVARKNLDLDTVELAYTIALKWKNGSPLVVLDERKTWKGLCS